MRLPTNGAARCTSGVTRMSDLFLSFPDFNEDIGSWDVGSATEMNGMFVGAESFDQDIGSWDVSKVGNMRQMFREAASFNRDLSGWCVSLIGAEPEDFDANAISWVLPRPLWGTCP